MERSGRMKPKQNKLERWNEELLEVFQKSEIEKRKSGEGDMMKKIFVFKAFKLLAFFLVFLFSCTPNPSSTPAVETQPEVKISVPEFSADSAFNFVKKQVDFGPRIPNSKAHDDCAKYLVHQFEKRGLKVNQQKGSVKAYDGKILNFNNITAQYQPEKINRVIISAHWDTRPWADQDAINSDKSFDGANDGGSGVGIILELARIISKSKLNVGVDLVLFDAEDYGKPQFEDSYCLGAQYWSRNPFIPNYHANYGINLDMVGDANAKFTYEGVSVANAKSTLDKVWRAAHTLGYDNHFLFNETSGITDDHTYVNKIAKIPFIDIIDRDPETQGFPESWHKHSDNMKNISPQTLKAVGQTLLYVLYTE